MSTRWRVVRTPAASGAWNMAVDEAILEQTGRRESLPTLRLYAWVPACVSLGQAQPYGDVDETRLKERGWDVVRRLTGGRAILHTDELTYSITAPTDEELVAGSLLDSYNRIAAALLRAVRSLGLNAEAQASVGAAHNSANPVCFEVPSQYEITVNGKKLIGSAQARRKDGVLQHGSLPICGDLARITHALVFSDEAARQEAASRLLARAATVESILGRVVSWSAAAEAFIQAFQGELGLRFEDSPLSGTEESRAAELVQEKYANALWTRRI